MAAGVTAAGVSAAALLVLPAGCGSAGARGGTTTIPDTSAARMAEAQRLAAQGQEAHRAGQTDRAIELYRRSLGHSPELAPVWNSLGLLYMEKDQYLDALEMFQAAADLMPGHAGAAPLYNTGLLYYRRGHHRKALEFFEESLRRDGRYLEALRGAVMVGKGLDLADEPALARVRTAMMVERDPRWRRMAFAEQVRIETALAKASESAPMEVRTGVEPPPAVGEPVTTPRAPRGEPGELPPEPPPELPPAQPPGG